MLEDLREKGRGGHVEDKHAPHQDKQGIPGVRSSVMQPQGYINQEITGSVALFVLQLFSHNNLVNRYVICISQTTETPMWIEMEISNPGQPNSYFWCCMIPQLHV